jgi:PRTRC genetic system ThiF family protein
MKLILITIILFQRIKNKQLTMATTKKRTIKKRAEAAAPPPPAQKVEVYHYAHPYLLNPQHPVTINLVGCGGTGSQVLNSLARMNSALKALGHPGLFVRAIDPDLVTEANMGRQLFSPSDVGSPKATVLISRINRFFGYRWEAVAQLYGTQSTAPTANITISCVDSGKARYDIENKLQVETHKYLSQKTAGRFYHGEPYNIPYYWLDFGNLKDRGQAVLGTLQAITQPKAESAAVLHRSKLPCIHHLHPGILKDAKGAKQGPSCSLAEALQHQDLFINSNLGNLGLGILWKLFRETRIKYHGLYLNLDNFSVNPIKVK